jgi:POT family proton-dependent oligopeptide transporter
VTYFADKSLDRVFLGIVIPPSVFRLFGPLFIVIFAPLMTMLWSKLSKRDWEPSVPSKLAIGLLLMSLSWVMLIIGVNSISPGVKVGMIWLIMMYFIYTMGELSLSPIGLSMVFKLSPVKFATILMAVWFLSLGTSFKISGVMSALYPREVTKNEINLPDKKLLIKTFNSLYELKPDSTFFARLTPNDAANPGRVWDVKSDNGKLISIEEQTTTESFKIDSVKLDLILTSDNTYSKEKTKFIYRFSPDGKNILLIRNNNVLEDWNLFPEKPKLFWIEIKTLTSFFIIFILMAGISSILLFALTKPLLKLMQGVR